MLIGIYQSIVTLAMIVAFYTVDVLLMRRYDRFRAHGSSRSWSWTAMALIAAIFVVVQPVLWPGLGLAVQARWGLWLQIMGLLLMGGGLVLHWWARFHLQQFYGERIEFQPGQYLVESGPYAYVRHPIYTSFFMCVIGLLLVNPSLPVLLVTVYFFVDFTRVARREESLLRENLPVYGDYMARTSRFLPRFDKSWRK